VAGRGRVLCSWWARCSDPRPRVLPSPQVVNYQHLMPTRYSLEQDELKSIVADSASDKVKANKEAKKVLEAKFKTGKQRWFFTKLRF